MTTATRIENPDRTDGQPVALGERLISGRFSCNSRHFGAHRPVAWPASLMNTGWPPLPFTFKIASQR